MHTTGARKTRYAPSSLFGLVPRNLFLLGGKRTDILALKILFCIYNSLFVKQTGDS